MENEQEFLPEYNIFERSEIETNDINWKFKQTNPIEYFKVIIVQIATKLEKMLFVDLQNNDVTRILSKISSIPVLQNKNATCLILGYLIVKNGIINENLLKKTRQIATKLEDDNINTEDVLRYARLWQTL